DVADRCRLPVLGSVSSALAAALAAYAEQTWSGLCLVVDADDHALTWSLACVDGAHAAVVGVETVPRLGVRAWKDKLLEAVADRCVRRSRRDPRASAPAEQALYDQLEKA